MYAFYFLIVGAAIWASSWAEISCWMWAGERQSTKMRIKYLQSALGQDIQFFDTEVRTSDVVFVINTDAVIVQDARSEKVKKTQLFVVYYAKTYKKNVFVMSF
ncbi:putative ABC transporter type 1, transmembrane domain-containing protein [Helianthus annuus]|nr:putative ABC transporter type 1, transmembrane domain-containing protein [Helianthus annuus]